MAMSMRTRGGLAASTNRPQIGGRPAYEDFKPRIESKEDPEAHIVYIHLPGFLKEQIRIVAESSRGLLRVRGERLVSANTWSRFLEEIPVPENCDITQTRAKFEAGVLRISMPKRISAAVSQSPSPTTLSDEVSTPERSPPQPPRPAPPPHPAPHRPIAPPPADPRPVPPPSQPAQPMKPAALPPPRTPVAPPRSEANLPPRMPEPRFTPSIQPNPRDETRPKHSPPQTPLPPPPAARFTPIINPKPREDEKPRSEAIQKPILTPAPKSSPAGLLQAIPQPDPAPRKDPIPSGRWWPEAKIPNSPEKPSTSGAPNSEAIQKPFVPPIPAGILQALPQPDPAPRNDPIAAERWRRESKIPTPPEMPVTRDYATTVGEASRKHESLTEDEKRRKAIKSISMRRLEDDRKLLVNMGVAVMVIFALGAWISYSFGSSAESGSN